MDIKLTKNDFYKIKELVDEIDIDTKDPMLDKIIKIEEHDDTEEVVITLSDVVISPVIALVNKWGKILTPQIKSVMRSLVMFANEMDQEIEKADKKLKEESSDYHDNVMSMNGVSKELF